MDQTTALADALLKTPSLIGGLLSQMESGAQGGLFSNLLSQDSGLQASLASLAQNPVTPQASLSTSQSVADSSSGDTLAQNLQNLSSSLHQVLDTLQQQNKNTETTSSATTASTAQTSSCASAASNTTAGQATTGQTQDDSASTSNSGTNAQTGAAASTTPASAPSASTTTTASTDNSGADDAGTNTTKLLTDIVAELLMLTQMMIKNLQQPQTIAAGDATSGAKANGVGLPAGAALGNLTGAAGTGAADDATLGALLGATSGTDTSGDAKSADASSADSLLKLFDLLQQTAQKLLPDTTASTVQTAATATTALPSIVADIAAIDAGLKNMLVALQQNQNKGTTTLAQVGNSATDNTAAGVVAARAAAVNLDFTAKPTADTWHSQMLAVASASTQASTTQTTQPTSGQVFAQAAALTAAAEKNTAAAADSDAGSDLLSGGNNTANMSTGTSSGTAAGAEGSAALGTYAFASQLSAFRAANGGAVGLPTVVDQVILQMNRSVKSGQDQMSLQLQPGDLGKITVKLDFGGDGKVQGTVTADNPKTLDMLQKDSRSLERALQDAGLRADPGSLQFSLGGQSNQNAAGQNAKNANNAAANDSGAIADSDGSPAGLENVAETYYVTPGGVNIRV